MFRELKRDTDALLRRSEAAKKKTLPTGNEKLARQVRDLMLDLSGDEDWARVPLDRIPLGAGDTASEIADYLQANSYEPHHLLK